MTIEDGLAKDGLSYRSDHFRMDILIAIYVYGSILWVALLIAIVVNNIHTRPGKVKKQKDFELLHVVSERPKSHSGRMTYVDSKSFRSDREKWEKSKSSSIRSGAGSLEASLEPTKTNVRSDVTTETDKASNEKSKKKRSRWKKFKGRSRASDGSSEEQSLEPTLSRETQTEGRSRKVEKIRIFPKSQAGK
ncbi:hypothetical protein Y032_0090g2340 [Ancylostoma ceylanicum]|uniref:Uncharacterized protein n=1 Tax=Ancylostoma ceylanicum TaxID=53326 RepID=A0A016TNA0_9BILA|nr:hypothetical protein Y032_0090g2340 [Ancylostoma ceylanicum]